MRRFEAKWLGMTPLLGINLITVSHACQNQGREKGLLAIPQGFYAEETGLYSRFQYCRVRLAKRCLVQKRVLFA